MGKKHVQGGGSAGVQLSLIVTPMLDMSFQILAFFIMTYHPSALEGHIPGSLVPPENFAKKSKDANVNPNENLLSVPDEELLPDLQGAITVKVKAIQKDDAVGSRVEGSPGQIFIKTSLETEPELVADVNVDLKKVALPRLDARLKEMLTKGGASSNTNIKIAADGDLRQQYVMLIYDTIKGAKIKDADNKTIGFEKIHFVPPPVLNAKFK